MYPTAGRSAPAPLPPICAGQRPVGRSHCGPQSESVSHFVLKPARPPHPTRPMYSVGTGRYGRADRPIGTVHELDSPPPLAGAFPSARPDGGSGRRRLPMVELNGTVGSHDGAPKPAPSGLAARRAGCPRRRRGGQASALVRRSGRRQPSPGRAKAVSIVACRPCCSVSVHWLAGCAGHGVPWRLLVGSSLRLVGCA